MHLRRSFLSLLGLSLLALLPQTQLQAESQLRFPRLTNENGTILGVTFVNPTDQNATLELVAYNADGLLFVGAGITNPALLEVPANQQLAMVATEIFGLGLAADTVGWFEATSAVDGITGFFLFLDVADTVLYGADLPQADTRIVFNRVEVDNAGGVSTELNIVNTQSTIAQIDLILVDEAALLDADPENDTILVRLEDVPAHAVRRVDVGSQFGQDPVGPSAYIIAFSNTRILGFEVVRDAGKDAIGLNAKIAAERLNRLYFPQLAVLGPFQMEIGVVNRSLRSVTAVFTAFRPDGKPYAAPQVGKNRVVRQIPAEFPFQANVQELFDFSGVGPAGSEEFLEGWILVESLSPALNGYVSYGVPENGSEAAVAALPAPLTEALIPHIATDLSFFTGVAALNPAAVAASYRIVALTPAGDILGSFDGILGPGERVSKLIQEYVPAAAGQAGGIIWIRSNSPLYVTALFGRNSLKVLSNIPAQEVLASYRPDAALPAIEVTPSFVVVTPESSQQFGIAETNGPALPVWTVDPEGSGDVDPSGLFTAPANSSDSPVTVEAADPTLDIRSAATVDILDRENFDPSLANVEALAYSPTSDRLFAAQPMPGTAPGSLAPQGVVSTRIMQITAEGASELTTLVGIEVRSILPFVGFDGTEFLLLAGGDRILRLDPADQATRVVAAGFSDIQGLGYDSQNGNLMVADSAGLALVSGAQIEPDRVSGLESNGSPTLRVLDQAGIGDVEFDPCSGGFYFSSPESGQILRFDFGGSETQVVVDGQAGVEHLLLLQRRDQACTQSGHLLAGSKSSDQVSLIQLSDGSSQPWQAVGQGGSMAFLPSSSALAETDTVVLFERGGVQNAGSQVSGGLLAVAVFSLYQTDPVNPMGVPQVGIYSDPVSDTFEFSGPALDVVEFSVTRTESALVLTLTLADPFVPCIDPCPLPPGSPLNALFGLIDLDLDQNPETGGVSFVDLQSPFTTGMGVEFCIDLGTYDPPSQTILVFRVIGNQRQFAGAVTMEVTSHTATIRVPLDLLGDDGLVNAAGVIGNPSEPTDSVPNGGSVRSKVVVSGN